ncbi:MAG: SoxR reducing system RseC family protein [Solirubrobacterales bacterium]
MHPDRGRTYGNDTVEGFARVVAVEGPRVVLEPEQTTACGHCVSSSVCGMGSPGNRLRLRRFSLRNEQGLEVGDRVVVGVSESSLLKASLVAYAAPLICMLVAMVVAQRMTGSDIAAMAGAVGGLALGFIGARLGASRLSASGDLAPKVIRRLEAPRAGDGCQMG